MNQPMPNLIAEQFLLSTGKKVTVYRCPYPSEGPVHVRLGKFQVLTFMYAHFVTWPEGTCRVDISHGTIEGSWPLWQDHPIEGRWSADSLVRFGRSWTHRHLETFRPPRGEVV